MHVQVHPFEGRGGPMPQSVCDGVARGSCRTGHEAARALPEDTLIRYRRVLGMDVPRDRRPGTGGW
jgi:hypothetical protein